jgi:hypothetical protein
MSLRRHLRRFTGKQHKNGYRLEFPRRVSRRRLLRELADLIGADLSEVRGWFEEYEHLHRRQRYAQRFGERKTLNFEEAFAIYAVLAHRRPTQPVVEIGTQHGRSTRRILDMLKQLGLSNDVVCFDVADQVQDFEPDEAELRIEDLTGRFREVVMEGIEPSLVFLDAHPYHLTREVITEVLDRDVCVLAIHDCGRALCNPNMAIEKDDPNITSATGHWERHVLCEVFGVEDPMSDDIDHQVTPTHALRILQTAHGLGLIVPHTFKTRVPAGKE